MNYNSFRRLLKNRYALSTVVTTLIILVISVLLASVVTYFAINVVSTRVQEESLSLSDAHIWLNNGAAAGDPTYSQAAIKVINTGGRDVVISKITVRGQDSAWTSYLAAVTGPPAVLASDSQFIVYAITDLPVQSDMYFQSGMTIPTADPMTSTAENPITPGTLSLTPDTFPDANQFAFQYATTDLILKSGYSMLVT